MIILSVVVDFILKAAPRSESEFRRRSLTTLPCLIYERVVVATTLGQLIVGYRAEPSLEVTLNRMINCRCMSNHSQHRSGKEIPWHLALQHAIDYFPSIRISPVHTSAREDRIRVAIAPGFGFELVMERIVAEHADKCPELFANW